MKRTNEQIEREAYLGILPVGAKERTYGFLDALLVLSGYCIATWSYTQGSYLATLVGFKQLLIGAFFGAILMLMIYQLPVILSVRYGIDIWIWLRSVFGTKGVKIMKIKEKSRIVCVAVTKSDKSEEKLAEELEDVVEEGVVDSEVATTEMPLEMEETAEVEEVKEDTDNLL